MGALNSKLNNHLSGRLFCLVLFFYLFSSTIAWAATHTVVLKITNPNATASTTPVHDSDGSQWTQVYVEIPAKLYMDRGWLDEDLANLRFMDVDPSGDTELAYWVLPKMDNNLRVDNLGLWLLVKDLSPGSTDTIHIEMVDGGTFYANPRAGSANQKRDRTHWYAASTVFPFYAIDSSDGGWSRSNSNAFANYTRFYNNTLDSEDDYGAAGADQKTGATAKTGNEFALTINNLKFNATNGSAVRFYFLSEASNHRELYQRKGYRLYFDNYTKRSDNLHQNRYTFTIKLQKYDASQSIWETMAESELDEDGLPWSVYTNSRHTLDIKVSNSQIFVALDGRQHNFKAVGSSSVTDGKYNRPDGDLSGGHFGYNRMIWRRSGEPADINHFSLRRFLNEEPSYEVYGNADLIVKNTKPGELKTLGEDTVENAANLQQLSGTIGGNTLNDYIFATYAIARPEQIVDYFKLIVKNRSSLSDETFSWTVQNSNPTKWIAYFCDTSGNHCVREDPATTTEVILGPQQEKEYTVKLVPTLSALVNGSSADVTVKVEGIGDGSFDNVAFKAVSLGNLGCFWEYKAQQSITWAGGHGYDDLKDYQVLVSIAGESTLQYAQPGGTDIVITDANGSILDYWLKSFDQSTNSLQAWVKVPTIEGAGGTTDIYVWWGNKNFGTSKSNKSNTFDLWEDWEDDYTRGAKVGCDDGTADCATALADTHGWENVPTPEDNYNWWKVETFGGSAMVQSEKGSRHRSRETGPFLHKGALGWDHYEVSYKIYTGTYDQYNPRTGRGNPQYNPVYFNDAGNMWGMEYFADKFIFRPYASGIDFVWQYQTNAKALLGSTFPKRNSWYSAKVRVIKDKVTGESLLKVYMSDPESNPENLPDVDENSSSDYTNIADFLAPPAFALEYGGVGFGGWDGGFAFDDIRVRKYTENDSTSSEPYVNNGLVTMNTLRDALTLSTPQITAPIFGGRPAYIEAKTVPFAWRGDLLAYYADCYVLDDCQGDEDSTKLGTVSVYGKIDDVTGKGAGYHLMTRDPGATNPPEDFASTHRVVKTTDNSGNLIEFGLDNCNSLQSFLGTTGACQDPDPADDNDCLDDATLDETEKLICFVRGYNIEDQKFPRSASRNFDASLGNNDTIADPNEQWKIGDVLHSSPLLVGMPNMVYAQRDYWIDFVDAMDERPLVAYFMSNDGMLHAIQLASMVEETSASGVTNTYYQPDPAATELWAFIPHAVLNKLKDTTDSDHEYTADGLLRAIDVKIDHDNTPSSPDEWRTVLFGIGGRDNVYAFGMDITDPLDPTLLWEMNGDPYNRIGTTISAPALGQVDTDGDDAPDTWVAVVGSGYDPEYLRNYETKNAWLTVFDLATGTQIKHLKVSDKVGNVTSDMAVLRGAKTGEIKQIYFGDYYGCLWRVSGSRIGRTDSNADLAEGATLEEDKDLLYIPEDYVTALAPNEPRNPIIVQPRIAKGKASNEFWVYFGTGDYDEFKAGYPNQYFYGLQNRATPYSLGDLQDMTLASATNADAKSWFIKLGENEIDPDDSVDYINDTSDGSISQKTSQERVIKAAEVFGGFVFFTSFEPINEPCGGGNSRFYAVNYRTGGLQANLFTNLSDSNGDKIARVRSVELETGGIPSQPMIMEGESGGDGSVIATGITTSSSGGIEKIGLDASQMSSGMNILLWREKR